MKVIIFGNLGYIGPNVVKQLRNSFPEAELIGFDIGYFAHCLTNPYYFPEVHLDQQIYGDIRNVDPKILEGTDAIVDLAAISNDPMGKQYEDITMEVNYKAAVELAKKAKQGGVKNFVYASSCSVYGIASEFAKKEEDELNPLTAYARSKIATEKELAELADSNFTITCHRFATACGFSNRLRLDLVLNDFVASAIVSKEIVILSDGTPWRPMINTKDMARAIEWSATRKAENGGEFLAVNSGSNEWNNQIKPLADVVAKIIPGTKVSVNTDAAPDKRSYRVNFDLFKSLAPNHQPVHDLKSTVEEVHSNLLEMNFDDPNFRDSKLIRLKTLTDLQNRKLLNNNLEWVK
ncbi:MAG: SDR family oxidoreductase [Bacteroidales bacterium]|nr:SDR family oxidoreductase [Bacteroidales bacterium]